MLRFSIFFTCALAIYSCGDQVSEKQIVYYNDFEDRTLEGIEGGILGTFQGETILGNYFRSGFTVQINDLPDHDYITVIAKLYIHDSWDGNQKLPSGPDIWGVELVGSTMDKFRTSFSNTGCNELYCFLQSYPEQYPNNSTPKTGSSKVGLPAFCKSDGSTSQYDINLTFPHNSRVAHIRFYDELVQRNTGDQLCDESWSVGELEINTWKL